MNAVTAARSLAEDVLKKTVTENSDVFYYGTAERLQAAQIVATLHVADMTSDIGPNLEHVKQELANIDWTLNNQVAPR